MMAFATNGVIMFSPSIGQRIISCLAGAILLLWAMNEAGAYDSNKWLELTLFMLAIGCFGFAAARKKAQP